jgi:hypothetical protein
MNGLYLDIFSQPLRIDSGRNPVLLSISLAHFIDAGFRRDLFPIAASRPRTLTSSKLYAKNRYR